MSADNTSLKEGMQITKEELLAQGCQLLRSFGRSTNVFKKGDQLVYWDESTQKIRSILSDRR